MAMGLPQPSQRQGMGNLMLVDVFSVIAATVQITSAQTWAFDPIPNGYRRYHVYQSPAIAPANKYRVLNITKNVTTYLYDRVCVLKFRIL